MKVSVKTVICLTASLAIGATLPAGFITVDFENYTTASGTVDLKDNDRITDQYEYAYGLTFSGKRYSDKGSTTTRPTKAPSHKQYGLSIYDTSGFNNNDNDLEPVYPNVEDVFGTGATYTPGNVLVIQENSSTHVGGADDNAEGGIVSMRWDEAVNLYELVVIDVGDNNENTLGGLTFKFYYEDGSKSYVKNIYGNGENKITLFDQSNPWLMNNGHNIVGLDIKSRASGALSSISFAPVPEPSQALFLGTAFTIGLVSLRRRRVKKS
jgi:hypothetical protein